jgi:heptose I phosphotransferase
LFLNASQAALVDELGIDRVARVFEPGFAVVLRDLGDRANAIASSSAGPLFLKRHAPTRIPWGLVEWSGHKRLEREGIATPVPVCAGADREGRSFLLTLALDGEPLDDFLRRGAPPPRLLRELTDELAGLVQRLHARHLCHKDLYLCHVFICPERPPRARLVLIDLQRLRETGRLRRRRWRVKDLAALAYSSVGLPLEDRTRLRFLSRYLGPHAGRKVRRRLARQVWRRACKLLRRHGIPAAPPPRPELP